MCINVFLNSNARAKCTAKIILDLLNIKIPVKSKYYESAGNVIFPSVFRKTLLLSVGSEVVLR
jgi:hypothetical protein